MKHIKDLNVHYLLRFVVLILFVVACNDPKPAPSQIADNSLTQEIDSLYKSIDPSKIDYLFNAKRSHRMQGQLAQMQYPQKLNLQLLLIKELLRSNKINDALQNIEEVNQVIQTMKIKLPLEIEQKFLMLHATVYLRQGEIENCIENHQSSSCIIPFSEQAIHVNKKGSESAIPLLEKVLAINPKNYGAIWLLNIAYETLGKSKSGLKPEFKIQFDKKNEGWKNIANNLGVDYNGLAGGVVADDFNNDGAIDLIFSAWGEYDRLQYFQNDGAKGFTNKSTVSNIDKISGGLNINHADFNNDGFLDIYVMRGAWFEAYGKIPNSLLKNNGDGTFTDVTHKSGIYAKAPTNSSVWMDVNMDGYLDLFVANESSVNASYSNELWINNGDETFTNHISNSGLNVTGWFKGATSICLRKESAKPDLFLSDYTGKNKLFLNESTKGKILFTDVTSAYKISGPIASFSCWAFDYNNDGHEDIFVSGYGNASGNISPISSAGANYLGVDVGATPFLYENEGNKSFKINKKSGLNKAVYTMGSNYGDIDNDGYLDFYLATGDPAIASIVPNLMYQNSGSIARSQVQFNDISFSSGMAHLQKGHGVAFADFDRDGDQDLYNVLGGAYEGDAFQNAYFENPGNNNNWVVLKLKGTSSNQAAIGARVKLSVQNANGQERFIYRKVSSGSSFGGNSLWLEIGLGNSEKINSCDVVWPFPNSTSQFENLEVNNTYSIDEGGGINKVDYKKIDFPQSKFQNDQ